jgi:hypothetical protein
MWVTNLVPYQQRKTTFDIFVDTFTDESPATHPVLPPAVTTLTENVLDPMSIPLPSEGNST